MHCLESGYFLPPLLLLLLLLAAATQTTAANREEMPAESHPGNPLKKPTTQKSLSLSLSGPIRQLQNASSKSFKTLKP
jgi:hypothetical protein